MARTLEKLYAIGVRDGFEIVLKLILGEETEGGGITYRGPLPPELVEYCQKALKRIEEEKKAGD